MIKKLVSCLLLLAAVSPIAAETTVRFVSVAPMAASKKFKLVSKGKHGESFAVPTNFLSPRMSVSSLDLMLFSVGDAEVASSCKITLPKKGKDFVVVVLPGAESLESFVIRSDDRSFKPGDYFIHNSSTETILGTLGTTEFKIEPNSATTVQVKGERGDKGLEVELFYLKDEKEHVISKTSWPIEVNIRSYVFFFTGKRDQPDYRAVDEFIDPSR